MSDILLKGYALKRKHDGAYLGKWGWVTVKDVALPNLYESLNKIKSLYKVRSGDIFPPEILQITPSPNINVHYYGNNFCRYNYKQYPDKLKELEAFAATEFEIVKMEISTKEVI